MAVKFTNNAVTTLTASVSAGVTQFVVASNSGFPSLGGADHTYVTVGSEVIKVTAISGTTFTCIATSSAHANGSNVELRVTAELLDDFATDLEAMPRTGGIFTGNVSFVDNKKLILGTGLDLELFHDGSHSYVNTSVGDLRLSTSEAGQSVQILGSGEALAEFNDDGDVDLFHNGTLKFSTTATGVNVVGNVTLSGTVDGVDIQSLNSAVTLNTAKTGITSAQATAISNNTAKTGITSAQTNAITVNTAKTGITVAQANAITNNTAKTGITSGQASAIVANTAKVGITSSQAASIVASLPKTGGTMTGNIAMSGSTTVDGRNISVDGTLLDSHTTAINANTAKTGITSSQASAITANTAKTGITSGQASAIVANTSKVGISSGQTSAITANTAKTGITSGQASAITANTAKVTNANHTGDVTGATALTIAAGAVDLAMLSATGTAGSGNFLRGDNSWSAVDGLPSQSGNSGKFLTTDATNASWATLDTDANETTKGLYEHAHTIAANYSISSGNNAMSAGPVTINSSISVTVPSGSTWVIA